MSPKNNKQTASSQKFPQSSLLMQKVAQFPNSKLTPPYSVVRSFAKNFSILRSRLKLANKHSVNHYPGPSGLTSNINTLCFYRPPGAFFYLQKFCSMLACSMRSVRFFENISPAEMWGGNYEQQEIKITSLICKGTF